jgi:2-haloacid dehalogenase
MSKTYVFDAYGTLFDVHSAVARHASLAGPDGARLSQTWRTKQLEYTWTRAAMGRYRDFQALTVEALDFALATVPGARPDAREALLEAYKTLDCYPEVPAVLSALRAQGHRLAILSNGTAAMLGDAVNSAGIGALLDDVISTDEIAIFKTAPQAYALVTDRYGLAPDGVLFQSSNRWDIAGATAFGFRCHWINRTGQPDEYADLPPAKVLQDISGLL